MKKYVINLDRRPDRLEIFKKKCPYDDVERIEAFDGKYPLLNKNIDLYKILITKIKELTVGESGCFMSHLLLWKKIIKDNHEYALIFEDDPIFCENFKEKCDDLIKNIYKIDTILYVGGRFTPNYVMENRIDISDNLIKYDYSKKWEPIDCDRGAFCYIITRECCKFLLSVRPEQYNGYLNCALDHYMINILRINKLNIFSSKPLLCHSQAVSRDSDIR